MMLRILAGIKDTWENFACSLGVIDKAKKDHYSRLQRKKDLDHVRNFAEIFGAHDWSGSDVQQQQ